MGKGKFYITTPIYYPSADLHIGHAYTTTVADVLARWHRFEGDDVLFLTGSDEHGQKIQRAAEEKGTSPQQYVDEIVAGFKELWQRLNITYDDFVRTTQPRHQKVVQDVFRKLYEKGRHLQRSLRRLVLHPLRNLLGGKQARRQELSRLRAAGGIGERGKLLL